MTKARCNNFGNCPLGLADGEVHQIDDAAGHACPLRDEGGECGFVSEVGGYRGLTLPDWWPRAAIALAAILLVLGAGYGIYRYFWSSPACKAADVQAMARGDFKLKDLESAGISCVEAAQWSGKADQLVAGTTALRTASDKGSGLAAYELGKLFDPEERMALEKASADLQLLPAADVVTALRFYDKAAAAGEARAATAAEKLRVKNPSQRKDARAKAGAALTLQGHDDLFQRVLAKPGAMLASGPGASGGTQIDTFKIFYVFENQPGWLKIGQTLERGGEGWVREEQVQPWNVMLVMHYQPQGSRSPVLFFRDEVSLKGLLSAPDTADQVAEMVRSAQGGNPDPRLAAVEDKAIDWATQPYVMPILRTLTMRSDSGQLINLAEIASVAGLGGSAGSAPSGCTDTSALALTHQIVFVIDTTESMGPYIEGVRRIARAWSAEVNKRGLQDRFRFGVVAYRNNMDAEPQRSGLEYVAKVVLPPAAGNVNAMVSAMDGVQPSRVSTHSFDEDAVAGLKEAMGFDWSQGCGVKQIYLVSDAGALAADDPKSRYPGTGLTTFTAEAHQKNIGIFPVHLQTPEAKRAHNVERTATNYRRDLFDGTGDNRYVAIPNGSPQEFGKYLGGIGTLIELAQKRIDKPPVTKGKPSIQDLVLADLFAVQQRFLGAEAGAKAPTFASSWTSDRDLANFDRSSLEVRVLLTRSEFSQLADTIQRLIDNARQSKMESSRFFELLRVVSAATAQDPNRFGGKTATLGAMLPSFLSLLPYKSEVLSINAEDWRSMGSTNQDAFLSRLGQKVKAYRTIYADAMQWHKLPGSDSGDDVAQIPLRLMP